MGLLGGGRVVVAVVHDEVSERGGGLLEAAALEAVVSWDVVGAGAAQVSVDEGAVEAALSFGVLSHRRPR